jgi:hypothetical protein
MEIPLKYKVGDRVKDDDLNKVGNVVEVTEDYVLVAYNHKYDTVKYGNTDDSFNLEDIKLLTKLEQILR